MVPLAFSGGGRGGGYTLQFTMKFDMARGGVLEEPVVNQTAGLSVGSMLVKAWVLILGPDVSNWVPNTNPYWWKMVEFFEHLVDIPLASRSGFELKA